MRAPLRAGVSQVRAALLPLLLVPAVLLVLSGATAVAAGPVRPVARQVVVVGVPGLRWEDVDRARTPALWQLAGTGAAGVLSVKAGPAVSCAADGFLTVGAGARATAYGATCGSAPRHLAAVLARNRRSRERADPAALATSLGTAGLCATADGPLSALALADASRAVAPTGGAATGGAGTDAGRGADGSAPGSCRLAVRQTGPVGGSGVTREAAAAAADRTVAAVLSRRSAGTTLLLVGLSEAPGDRVAHLHVALAVGPGFHRGTLGSASTGRAPYVQLVDVAPTVLSLLGRPVPATMTGQPWQPASARLSPAGLQDLDRRAVAQKAATVPFFVVVLVSGFVLLAGLLLAGRRRAAEAVALVMTAVPGAAFLAGLVPWWRVTPALPALLGCTLAGAAGMAAVALAAKRASRTRSGPVAVVCGLTTLVLAVDLLTGSHLQLTSVAGYSPVVAGRFRGIGNVAFGVYAAAGLIALGWSARARWEVVVLGGAVLVLLDGAPPWGSDVGGVLALLPAVVVLALLSAGRRLSVLRLAAAGAGAVLLVTLLALADHARPPARRTHLGRFVEQVGNGTAGDLLHRKAAAVLGLLFHSPVTALLPLVVLAVVLLVLRPPAVLATAFAADPAYRRSLTALAVACALGFVLNDSGAAVPALALVVVLPATVAVVSAQPPDPRSG